MNPNLLALSELCSGFKNISEMREYRAKNKSDAYIQLLTAAYPYMGTGQSLSITFAADAGLASSRDAESLYNCIATLEGLCFKEDQVSVYISLTLNRP